MTSGNVKLVQLPNGASIDPKGISYMNVQRGSKSPECSLLIETRHNCIRVACINENIALALKQRLHDLANIAERREYVVLHALPDNDTKKRPHPTTK